MEAYPFGNFKSEPPTICVVRNSFEFKQFCMSILLDSRIQEYSSQRDMLYNEKRFLLELAQKVVDKKVIVAHAEATAVVIYPDGLWQCFKALLREKFPRLFGWLEYREAEKRDEKFSTEKVEINVEQYYPQVVRVNNEQTIVFHSLDLKRSTYGN